MDQTEVGFLEDLNALVSAALESRPGGDPWAVLKQLADEIRERIGQLEETDKT
jgi:hypothetical protein